MDLFGLFHPLVRVVATRPELIAEHVGAYAELASAQASDAARRWRGVALFAAAGAVLALVGLTLAGVSLLLWAAMPAEAVTAGPAWLMWLVPGLPLALGLGCAVKARGLREQRSALPSLREQIAIDAQLWAQPQARA